MLKSVSIKLKKHIEHSVLGGHKPDFMIIGAQKCGTTSLFSYLDELASFSGSQPKEVHYFDREDNFRKGHRWYESRFLKKTHGNQLFFEASPTYLCREKVPARLKAYNPDLKLILILREPTARAYSAWNMYRQWSEEGILPWSIANDQYGRKESPIYSTFFKSGCPSFTDYIQLEMELIKNGDTEEEPSLLRRGLYKQQIERYVNLFGWDNILVLGFNELKNDSESVIRKCHEFLGVPYQAQVAAPDEKEIKNKRSYPSKISSADFEILREFYEQPNQELFDYLGYQPDW
ncbi:sulfotransferase domain-containing protein [Halomonas alimentaria]|uniref:Sulfotransferase domain-containing protein n=1 Tax=Halomonas alimentaria TaxID=147248 RepID=A0A7X4W5W6_9GAMM|nr:sulfotransferase domain-containing protein [Halomonas alimentaria]NAW34718.1 hypothetical protein [Halomonas alimentaria]